MSKHDEIAANAAATILRPALAKFHKKLTPKVSVPVSREALTEYVNKLQDALRELSESVGDARYQLTGARGD